MIVLATDGVWDFISNADAISIVKGELGKGSKAVDAAKALTFAALKKGGKDENASAIVVVV